MAAPLTAEARRLRFAHYVLDRDRGCLLDDGVEVPLRAKTFAVLDYLVEHPSRADQGEGPEQRKKPKETAKFCRHARNTPIATR
jgi:hypothetical protein